VYKRQIYSRYDFERSEYMPRGAKTIENCAGHRTKKEKEVRDKAEAAMLTGQKCFERDCVKADPVAHKEYLRLTKLLSKIQKNDALYGASINRYCELYSEVNAVKADAVTQRAVLSKIEIAFNNLSDEEITGDELMKFTKLMSGALAKIADLDKIIMQKRKMMSDIEKENGWTVLSAIRAIPKQAENSEDDALMKILQGGKNNGAV
jgi:hypothetical protein